MKYTYRRLGLLAITLLGLAVWKIQTMEEVHQPEAQEVEHTEMVVPLLVQLAVVPAAEYILRTSKTTQEIHDKIAQLPFRVQVPLAYALIQDARYQGTPREKLQLAYQVSKEAGEQQIPQLDALFNDVMDSIDPCLFVNAEINALLPDYQQQEFTLRDERLIKAILRKPGFQLPEKYLKNPMLSITTKANPVNGYLSPDGSKLAWGTDDTTLCIWNIQENKPVAVFRLPATFAFDPPMAWSPDSRLLAVADDTGLVHFWHIDAVKAPVVRLQVPGMSPYFNELGVDPLNVPLQEIFESEVAQLPETDHQFLQGLSPDNQVNLGQQNILVLLIKQPDIKNSATWYLQRRTDISPGISFKADNDPVYSLSFSPDGKFLTTLSEERRVRVWDIKDVVRDTSMAEVMPPLFEHTCAEDSSPVAAVLSNNGKRLAVAPVDDKVVIFDVENGVPVAEVATDDWNDGYVGLGSNAIAMSPDGRYLAYTYAGNYYLYDIDTDKNVVAFERGHVSPTQVFSPGQSFKGDGGLVSCMAEEHPLVVYGIHSRGKLKVTFGNKYDEPASFSGDGSYFATRNASTFNMWHLPLNYVLGNLTWQQLRDELARKCLQVMPVNVDTE